jgi:CxxC motif-containing protein
MKKKIVCIICPMGCEITVTGKEGVIDKIEGNQCARGEAYAKEEFLDPKRILTTTVKAQGYTLPVLSVRSSKPIPKRLLAECMDILKKVKIKHPVTMGQVVVENILDTGVDIIATKC